MPDPAVSIVIPCLNSGNTLERAIYSVLNQGYPNVELIVIDGGSIDSTHFVVEKYRSDIAYFCSERDSGTAEAINKGIRKSTGKYFNWLGADDELVPGGLDKLVDHLEAEPDVDLVTGGCVRRFPDHHIVTVPPADFCDVILYQNHIEQPSSLLRSSVFERFGLLDESYRYAFDWEFWCRLARAGSRMARIDDVVSIYFFSDSNLTSTGGRRIVNEMCRVMRRHGPLGGRLAFIWRLLYEFDLRNCYDKDRTPGPATARLYATFMRLLLRHYPQYLIYGYNWNWASRQERKLDWHG